MNDVDLSLVDWSRGQFALTAMYHWLFVPLTLGLGFLVAFMETIYVKTGNPEWKRITKFWMTLFGINFAIGVATGIILEFQFGTNWSNYSWFVGDIFGAPLAIEGIMAFFLESTFIAIMFFGWTKVSAKTHLFATWLVAFGACVSALWILVANAWMQYPVGMHFNPDVARNEMHNFWDVLFSPMAINKFLHTISAGFVLASMFVLGISAWYLIKKREQYLAIRSIIVASVFGLLTSIFLATTGDTSARLVSEKQPMKLAAAEGLYNGQNGASLKLFGILGAKNDTSKLGLPEMIFSIEVPKLLSIITHGDANAFIPGVNDLVYGNAQQGIISANEKIQRGTIAKQTLRDLKNAKKSGDSVAYNVLKTKFLDASFQKNYFAYFGYSFFNNTADIVPNISILFYSFRIMVVLGFYFILFFIVILVNVYRNNLVNNKVLLWIAIWSIPLPYLANQAGWIVAEVGRQPWVIQDYLPAVAAVSNIDSSAVKITFWLFAIVFTALLIAEVKIMCKQIKMGPKEH